MNPSRFRFHPLIIVSALAGLVACAEVAAPPGGEEDRSRPTLLESWPTNGAVDVPPDNRITIQFSERVKQPGSGTGVFISPRPIQKPEVKWKSDRLEILMADSFLLDQTYVIAISSDVRDLRNNAVDTGATIAFSTGPTIDSGSVSGFILEGDKGLTGTKVALFDPARLGDSLKFDSLYPDYLVQSGVGGYFSFNYLPNREFFLIAFEDENRDDWFSKQDERFALPDRPAAIGGELSLDSLYLPINRYDSAGQGIVLARLGVNGMLRLRLKEEVETGPLGNNLSWLTLESDSDPNLILSATALLETYLDRSRSLNYYVPNTGPGLYRVRLLLPGKTEPLLFDSLLVDEAADLIAPELIKFLPGSLPVLKEEAALAFYFSEPLDDSLFTDGTILLWQDSITQEPFSSYWESELELRLDAPSLKPGRYTVSMVEFEIADPSGNKLGDTLKQLQFTLLDPDSLGSVSGRCFSSLTDSASQLLLRFEKYQNGSIHEQLLRGTEFNLDLPAGSYRMTGFVDRNRNGRRDAGSLEPLTYSETYSVYPDTVKVRARFETTGLEFEIK
ncbi:MAG: Ig-like domain-containing protein [bacterium]|nr:Ig-like domain-containing protein [bacterium]